MILWEGCISFARSYGATKAEAEVPEAAVGLVPAVERGAAETRAAVPAAAAQDTKIARCSITWITGWTY